MAGCKKHKPKMMVETCPQCLINLVADNERLKEKLKIYKYTEANINHAYDRGYDNGAKQTKDKEI